MVVESKVTRVPNCRDCGTAHPTGSQIFYECPVNGSWKSAFDNCELHSQGFDNVGHVSISSSEKSVAIALRDNPFGGPCFVSRRQLLELLDGRRKSCVVWRPTEHR